MQLETCQELLNDIEINQPHRDRESNNHFLFRMPCLNTKLHMYPNHTTPIFFTSLLHSPIYFCLLILFYCYCMCIVHLPVLLCYLVLWPQDWINTTIDH